MSSNEPSATRQAIVRACLDLLERGIAPSMSEIAARAGKSRQAVYLHFESRTALLLAAVEQVRIDFGARDAFAAIVNEPDADAALRGLVDLHTSFTPRIINASRALDTARAEDSDFDAAWHRRDQGNRRQLVRAVLSRFAAANRLAPPWTLDSATDWLWALLAPSFMHALLSTGWTPQQVGEMTRLMVQSSLLVNQPNHPAPEAKAPSPATRDSQRTK